MEQNVLLKKINNKLESRVIDLQDENRLLKLKLLAMDDVPPVTNRKHQCGLQQPSGGQPPEGHPLPSRHQYPQYDQNASYVEESRNLLHTSLNMLAATTSTMVAQMAHQSPYNPRPFREPEHWRPHYVDYDDPRQYREPNHWRPHHGDYDEPQRGARNWHPYYNGHRHSSPPESWPYRRYREQRHNRQNEHGVQNRQDLPYNNSHGSDRDQKHLDSQTNILTMVDADQSRPLAIPPKQKPIPAPRKKRQNVPTQPSSDQEIPSIPAENAISSTSQSQPSTSIQHHFLVEGHPHPLAPDPKASKSSL